MFAKHFLHYDFHAKVKCEVSSLLKAILSNYRETVVSEAR